MGSNLTISSSLGQNIDLSPHILVDQLQSTQEIMIRIKSEIWEKLQSDRDMTCILQVILEFLQQNSSKKASKYDSGRSNGVLTKDTDFSSYLDFEPKGKGNVFTPRFWNIVNKVSTNRGRSKYGRSNDDYYSGNSGHSQSENNRMSGCKIKDRGDLKISTHSFENNENARLKKSYSKQKRQVLSPIYSQANFDDGEDSSEFEGSRKSSLNSTIGPRKVSYPDFQNIQVSEGYQFTSCEDSTNFDMNQYATGLSTGLNRSRDQDMFRKSGIDKENISQNFNLLKPRRSSKIGILEGKGHVSEQFLYRSSKNRDKTIYKTDAVDERSSKFDDYSLVDESQDKTAFLDDTGYENDLVDSQDVEDTSYYPGDTLDIDRSSIGAGGDSMMSTKSFKFTGNFFSFF